MEYTREEAEKIGRQVYEREISARDAAEKYGISVRTVMRHQRLYREQNGLSPKHAGRHPAVKIPKEIETAPPDLAEMQAMSKEELIQELVKSRIRETRLKKGYEVKGDGSVIVYDSKNTR